MVLAATVRAWALVTEAIEGRFVMSVRVQSPPIHSEYLSWARSLSPS
jgi:hypothetical protein